MKKAINLLANAKFAAEEFMNYRLQTILNHKCEYGEIHLFVENATDFLEYSAAIAKLEGKDEWKEKRHISELTDVLIREKCHEEEKLILMLVGFRESLNENTIEQFLKQRFKG